MKSKIAEEYIDENIYDAAECVDKDGCGWAVVKRSDAYRAVELAEEEMVEKAGRAFCERCDMHDDDGTCLVGYHIGDCKIINGFKRKIIEK